MSRARAGLLLVLLSAAAPGRAQLIEALTPGLLAQGTPVTDEQGRARDLGALLRGDGPILLLPVFTRCAAACPLLAMGLKDSLAKLPAPAPFRVVVFSFDAADSPADLRSFRRELELPADWAVVRASSDGGAHAFLDQFGYSLMGTKSGFVHPSEVLVLSGKGRWSATLAGTSFDPADLSAAARDAAALDRPTVVSRWRRAVLAPQNWAVGALLLLALGAAAAMASAARRPRR